MELYLIRHAESANNARPTYQRVEDPEITAVGRLQSQHLASWLTTLKADVLVTSPFLRTLQTVIPVLDSTDHSLEIWHDVFERGGCFRGYDDSMTGAKGMGRGEILRTLGKHASRCAIDVSIEESGWWGERPVESDAEADQRARDVCRRLLRTFTDGQVVVLLIHADLKRLMLAEMMTGQMDVSRLGPMRNAGITKINRIEDDWQLDYFNSVTHLPAKLITGNEH